MVGLTNAPAFSIEEAAEATGTVSFDETAAGEATFFTVARSRRARVGSIYLDTSNITQNTTFRLYERIDGTNYRLVVETAFVAASADGFRFDEFTTYRGFRVTGQCGGGGGGSVDVPYAVV